MYLKDISDDVRVLIEKVNELDNINIMKFTNYIFDLWINNQINSLNETNPLLLDDSVNITIFNPNDIGMHYITNEIKEYFNIKYNLYRFYPKEYIKLISLFDKLTYEDKIKTIAELFLILDYDDLLPSDIDSYKIARLILNY